jgi:hypothetical protein
LVVPIDDPLSALQQQFDLEELSTSPVTKRVLAVLSVAPLGELLKWPFEKLPELLQGHLASDSILKIQLLLDTCFQELRRHEKEIEQLRQAEESSHERETILRELLLDAARKAENTRAPERIERIGLILANVSIKPLMPDPDEAEEMMRVATELSDNDIRYLQELVRIEGESLRGMAYLPRFDAHSRWPNGFWLDKIDPEIDSVFSKLESYGLVSRIPPANNQNIMAEIQNRYVLLPKGLRFVDLIKSRTQSS